MPANTVKINGSNDHEWVVPDSKMDSLIAILDAVGERTWVLCDSDVADEYRVLALNGEWSEWRAMPEELKGNRTYPGLASMIQHRHWRH